MLEYSSERTKSDQLTYLFTPNLSDGIFDLSSEAFFILNFEGTKILDCNRTAIKLFQAESKSQLLDFPFYKLYHIHPLDYSEGIISDQIEHKGEVKQELNFITCKGNKFWGSMIKRVIQSKTRKVILVKISLASDYLKSNETLSILLRNTSKDTGKTFFKNLTRILLQVLGANFVFVGKLSDKKISRIEIIEKYGNKTIRQSSFSTKNSCVSNVLKGYSTIYPDNLQELFLNDKFIKKLSAESFLGSPIYDASGIVIGLIGVISNEKMVEIPNSRSILSILASRCGAEIQRMDSNEILRQQTINLVKTNQLKDGVLNLINYDLKKPLKSILDFSNLIINNLDNYSKEQIREKIRVLRQAIQNLDFLTENVIDWTKIEQEKIDFKPTHSHIKSIIAALIPKFDHLMSVKNISVINDVSNDLYAFADIEITRTILRNLISNALKFSENGAKITCKAAIKDKTAIISIEQPNSLNSLDEIEKSYNNAAINLNNLNNQHPLLGLYLSKTYASIQGGRIWFEQNKTNPGICFYLELPIIQ